MIADKSVTTPDYAKAARQLEELLEDVSVEFTEDDKSAISLAAKKLREIAEQKG